MGVVNGIFQMSMSGTSEALDQHNGKFYTVRFSKCQMTGSNESPDVRIVGLSHRMFVAGSTRNGGGTTTLVCSTTSSRQSHFLPIEMARHSSIS